jgi:choline-sulfatase
MATHELHRPLRSRWRRGALALVLALSAGVVSCGRSSQVPHLRAAARGWNVLLISVDTLRADHLGAYGYSERRVSPTIDGLLAQGIRFEQADAQRALTWPSLGSVLTGLYPSAHGLLYNGYRFPDDLPTLPKILHASGYQTGAFLSNMCHANHLGWDERYCSRSNDGRLAGHAMDWLAKLDPDKPFLLWLHYFGAHPPYFHGGRRAERMDPGYAGSLGTKMWQLEHVMTNGIPLDGADLKHLNALYDAAILGTDRRISRFLRRFDELVGRKHTLIIFLADHGEDLYQHHNYIFHACSVYQSGLHVPLAFIAPGLLPQSVEVQAPVELIDVLPTVLDLLGIQPPPVQHGRSLLPLLEQPNSRSRRTLVYSEYSDTRIHTVSDGRWKLIDNPDEFLPLCFAGAPPDLYPIQKVELYDLQSDPDETTNLAERNPGRVHRMQAMIWKHFSSLQGSGTATRQDVPEDVRKQLEALGYVAN